MRELPESSKARMVREAAVQYVPGEEPGQLWMPAAEFKTHCLRLIEQVRQGGGEVVVTRYGRPVAKLVPFEPPAASIFGHVAGAVTSYGDLVSPIDEAWEADA